MNYTHLTREERYQIHALRRQGLSYARIAAELNRSVATITREIKRNSGLRGYKPGRARAAGASPLDGRVGRLVTKREVVVQ